MRLLIACLTTAERVHDAMGKTLMRILFVHVLSARVRDRLQLIGLFRRLVKLSVLIAVALLVLACFYNGPKLVQISGMLFDLAGLSRIFIDEEWENILEHYRDQEAFPYGPPSHITREMFVDDNPDAMGEIPSEAEGMARHFYWRRGLTLVLIGFVLQLVGTATS